MQNLLLGHQKFLDYFNNPDNQLYRTLLSNTQQPKIMLITCADSRLQISRIFNSFPGEIFIIRNVANLVPPFDDTPGYHGVSAGLAYAVLQLNISNIILLGHSYCGGIEALLKSQYPENQFIRSWLMIAHTARDKTLNFCCDKNLSFAEQAYYCEKEALKISFNNLKTYDFIAERLEKKLLRRHAWHFNHETAEIICFNEQSNQFEKISLDVLLEPTT